MLIYHNQDNILYVTEVMHDFCLGKVQTFAKQLKNIPSKHATGVKLLKDGQVFVTGSTSCLGNGIHDRFVFKHYLDGMHFEPDQQIHKGKKNGNKN